MQNDNDFALVVDMSNVKSITPQCFLAWENALDVWTEQGLKVTARIDKPEAAFYKIFLAGLSDIYMVILRTHSGWYLFNRDNKKGLKYWLLGGSAILLLNFFGSWLMTVENSEYSRLFMGYKTLNTA